MRLFLTIAFVLLAPLAALAADPRVGLQLAYGSSTSNVVESIAPPVVERGKTTRVTFVGHDLAPGLDIWHSLPKGALTAKPVTSEPRKLVFDITASADAPVGVCGLRLATRDGLTNAVLFHVEDLPVKGNVANDKPVSLALPACVWGTFLEGNVDRYTITVAAGERVSFEAIANRLGKDADPLITIRDSAGKFVTERDNDPGLYFDFRFEHSFSRAGTYTLEVRDARLRASEHHHYILRVGKFPPERVAVPAAIVDASKLPGQFFTNTKRPGDQGSAWVPVGTAEGQIAVAREFNEARDNALSQATSGPTQLAFMWSPLRVNLFQTLDRSLTTGHLQATPVSVPGVLCGTLRTPNQRVAFAFKLDKGQRIFVKGEAKALNSPADIEVMLTDHTGRELRRASEPPNGGEVAFDFTAGTPGEYGLVVRDVLNDGSDSHAFRLTVRSDPFPPVLTAEVEGLTVPQGSYQAVPILVTRTGTTGPIKLSLLGAPAGLKLTPAEIPETANAVVCRLSADGHTPPGVHTVQIAAECGAEKPEKVLVRTRPLIDKKLQNVDLIPIAMREDQARLPPALTDRFAVQITPPSPFTFELPEQLVTLTRFQSAPIPVVTTRVAGFDGPITFLAVGGQLADKNEGRTRVYADFPQATAKELNVSGMIVSKILSNIGKTRIDVTATGTHQGRRVSLTRTFDLDLITAFRFPQENAKASLLPGESTTVKLTLTRYKTFEGPITLQLYPAQGLEFPESVTIPKGQNSVEFPLKATLDAQPRKQNMNVMATGEVGGFEEELRGSGVEIEIKKVEVPKKK
jgi:hypothetical protein